MATQHPDIQQDIDITKTAPSLKKNTDYGRIGGLREIFGKAAVNISMIAVVGSPFAAMANTAPSDAEALPTANSATTVPNAKNAFAEVPVISDDDIRKTLREQPRTFTDVADPAGNRVNFAVLDAAENAEYVVLSVTPTVKNEAGVTYELVTVMGTADGHYFQVVPETSSVAKWETFGSASGSYNLARSTIALPISSLGDGKGLNGLTGSTLYAGFTKNGDINALLRDGVYGKLKYFEKTSSSAPAASDSVNMMPGAEVLSAPIKMSSIPDITYPARVNTYGDALLQINGGEWVKEGVVNANDLVVTKGKSAALSKIKAEFGFMVNGEHKVKTKVETLEYKTVNAATLSDNKNDAPDFVAVRLTLPAGATNVILIKRMGNGNIPQEYKDTVIRIDPNDPHPEIGIHCKISYELNGASETKYFDIVPK